MKNSLISDEGRTLYYIIRDMAGNANDVKRGTVPYKKKDRKLYIRPIKAIGGNMYHLPPAEGDNVIIVYEQKDRKPAADDKIVAVLGESIWLKSGP